MRMRRRAFLAFCTLTGLAAGESGLALPSSGGASRKRRLFFTSQGRTALMNADGTGLYYFDFKVPDQVTWQPGPFFSDGRRVIFLSMEQRRDGPGHPFEEYYTQTPTHLWAYDLERKTLTEL